MIECLSSMYDALGLIPYIIKEKQFRSSEKEFQTKLLYADIYAESCGAAGNSWRTLNATTVSEIS